jgi:hypothetical protein
MGREIDRVLEVGGLEHARDEKDLREPQPNQDIHDRPDRPLCKAKGLTHPAHQR